MRIEKAGPWGLRVAVAMLVALLSWSVAVAGEEWPRTFDNVDGSRTEIPTRPQRILSTSVSTTGTLLAIGAPVVASGSAGNGRFFAQWADVAAWKTPGRPAGSTWRWSMPYVPISSS